MTTDDIHRVRPGDYVKLCYECDATLSGTVKEGRGGLVLDIPGDNYVVRHGDGSHEEGVVRVEITERPA